MSNHIVITSIGSVSSLGSSEKTIIENIQSRKPHFSNLQFNESTYPVFPIHPDAQEELYQLLEQYPKYKRIDRTAQLGILATKKCFENIDLNTAEWVINAGSSRGATGLWEKYYNEFNQQGSVPVKSSPLTTLGNISTHIAQHQKLKGYQIDHSITCSSGLQSLANGYAWLKSGLTQQFLAVGAEAPLTHFTITQMAALGIYATNTDVYPCKPCSDDEGKNDSFCLGEAAVAIALHTQPALLKGDVVIAGMGTGSETITHPASISPNGEAFQISMKKALENAGLSIHQIDLIIPHSPGTIQGDRAEKNAIGSVFGELSQEVINHKFLTGHTLGASGLLSIELAYLMLTKHLSLGFPYPSLYTPVKKENISSVLINSMGFGGNAVTIIVQKQG